MAESEKSETTADTMQLSDSATDLNESVPPNTTSVIKSRDDHHHHQPLDLSLSPSPEENLSENGEILRTSMDKRLIPQQQIPSTSAKYDALQNNYTGIWTDNKYEPASAYQSMIPIRFIGDRRSTSKDIVEHYMYPNLKADFHKNIFQRQVEGNMNIGRLITTPDLLDVGECSKEQDKACTCHTQSSERNPEFADESSGAESGFKCEAHEYVKVSHESFKIRKRKLSESKLDDSYLERRKKNNAAAKKSRDARRANEQKIAARADFLEKENLRLRIELETLLRNKHLYS